MTSMFSLADFMLRSPPGGDCDWLTPPQSPSGARTPQRHDERGMETSNWPNPGTSTWPPADTFPRPRTYVNLVQSQIEALGGSVYLAEHDPHPGTSIAHKVNETLRRC